MAPVIPFDVIGYNCEITQFKSQCKGQTYKAAEIILLCHKLMCLFHTEPFTCELIVKRHSLSCHYKIIDYYKILVTVTTEIWPKIENWRWRPPPFWILAKVGYSVAVAVVWPISISVPNLRKISSFTTKIWPKIENLRWRAPPSWFFKKV